MNPSTSYFHEFLAPCRTGSGLDDWIFWHLLLQFLLITINYKNLQSSAEPFFLDCRGLDPFSFSFYDWLLSWSWSYFTTGGLPPISWSWWQALETEDQHFFQRNTCFHIPYVTSSLTRGWVCRLQLLLVLVGTVIHRSESRGTHNHILLSQVRHFPDLEGQVPLFISPRKRVTRL
jgi:hypothetical protein